VTFILALFLAFADISGVKAEPNLEKRSDLALENANRAIDDARAAYQAGDVKKADANLEEVRESVDVSLEALENSGKPARNSKYFKRAELKIRGLLRRLAGFRDEMSVDDRRPLDDAAARLQDVHDRLLLEIMSKNKKR
jgi:hypothetical protein